jgi:hypothetical protein
MVRDEAPAATTGGINEWECDHLETGPADGAGFNYKEWSDQLRCCGNPSWT